MGYLRLVILLNITLYSPILLSQIFLKPGPFSINFCQKGGEGLFSFADIKVANASLALSSIKLSGFDIGSSSTATVYLRITSLPTFTSNVGLCQSFLSNTVLVTAANNGIIVIPSSCTLLSNKRYLIGINVESSNGTATYDAYNNDYDNAYDSTFSIQIGKMTWESSFSDTCPTAGVSCMPVMELSLKNPLYLFEESSADISVSLFPNPSADFLNVLLSDKLLNKSVPIKIYNALGFIIETDLVQFKNGSTKLNISNLSNGLYFLEFETNSKLKRSNLFCVKTD